MRLVSLQLTRYGNFAANRIDFDPLPGRVDTLFAPNGGGKSVVRQAFCDLLFGISGQTPMGFRYGYSGMRITAEAIAPDGTRVAFGRRKGQGNTLVDADGNLDKSGALARLLGRADRGLLQRLFALDTERLRRGGDELLASGGAVRRRPPCRGWATWRQGPPPVPRSSSGCSCPSQTLPAQRPFYPAVDGLQEARRRAAGALLRPDDWVRNGTGPRRGGSSIRRSRTEQQQQRRGKWRNCSVSAACASRWQSATPPRCG